MIGIYSITCKINRRRYIGQSVNIDRRFYEHKKGLSSKKKYINQYLQRAYKKYGEHNFDFEILELCEQRQLNEREKYWINYYSPNVYNFELNPTVNVLNNEIRKKMSDSAKKRAERKSIRKMLRQSGFYKKENKNKTSVEYVI